MGQTLPFGTVLVAGGWTVMALGRTPRDITVNGRMIPAKRQAILVLARPSLGSWVDNVGTLHGLSYLMPFEVEPYEWTIEEEMS